MASIENEIIGIIFTSITVSCIFDWQKSIGITEVSVVPMAKNMCTPFKGLVHHIIKNG